MIDVDKLEKAAAAAETGIVALTTDVFAEICAALRSGNAAIRQTARDRAFGEVCEDLARPVHPPLAKTPMGYGW